MLLALDRWAGQQVAIKFIPIGPDFKEASIRRELTNQAMCSGHPHIVQLLVPPPPPPPGVAHLLLNPSVSAPKRAGGCRRGRATLVTLASVAVAPGAQQSIGGLLVHWQGDARGAGRPPPPPLRTCGASWRQSQSGCSPAVLLKLHTRLAAGGQDVFNLPEHLAIVMEFANCSDLAAFISSYVTRHVSSPPPPPPPPTHTHTHAHAPSVDLHCLTQCVSHEHMLRRTLAHI